MIKQLGFLMMVFFSMMIANLCFGQNCQTGNAPTVEEPYIYGGECHIGMERYLSRTVSALKLAALNTNTQCWGPGGPYPGSSNCNAPYNECWGRYCPQKYCDVINSFADLNAQLILRTVNFWGAEKDLIPEAPGFLFTSAQDMVEDINEAYDSRGFRRPIIQGVVFEGVGTNVEHLKIPQHVINTFYSSMTWNEKITYVFTNSGWNRHYDYESIEHQNIEGQLEITKIEGIMWMYHQATILIDLGFKSIWMGQYGNFAEFDNNYVKLDLLTTKIRDYASSKNSFVLLCGEVPGGANSAKVGNSNQLIFDFDIRAMRPKEVLNFSFNNREGCPDPIPMSEFPCQSQEPNPAVIDECIIDHFGGTTSGTSPMGCQYDQVPYVIYFDFGSGIIPPLNQPSFELTWGYDDARWFESLSPGCRIDWWTHFADKVRGDSYNSHGFLQAPSSIILNYPELANNSSLPVGEGLYIMSDESSFQNAVESLWEPTVPNVEIQTVNCSLNIEVTNPDPSSVYSIHVKRNGSWLPQTLGTLANYTTQGGSFEIIIRQDNLGFSGSSVREYLYNRFGFCFNFFEDSTNDQQIAVELAPNPISTNSILNIHYKNIDPSQISIFNSLGKHVYNKSIKNKLSNEKKKSLNLSNLDLSPGVHFVLIADQNGNMITKKILVI